MFLETVNLTVPSDSLACAFCALTATFAWAAAGADATAAIASAAARKARSMGAAG
jgi:hypothetical protein